MVEAAGGSFIKWTGDGFLAWFEVPLHRDLLARASDVIFAAWFLSLVSNTTQLCVKSNRGLVLRHGITYEQDALLTRISYKGGFHSLDLLGRAVVLAFRLSGVPTGFPAIATQRELLTPALKTHFPRFVPWKPTTEDRLKFFKGENWGTSSLFVSGPRSSYSRSMKSVLRQAKRAVRQAERPQQVPVDHIGARFAEALMTGPEWCQEVLAELLRFLREDLLGTVKLIVPAFEKAIREQQTNPAPNPSSPES